MRPSRRTFVLVALALVGGMLLLWMVRQFASTASIEIVAAEYGVPGRTCTAEAEIKKHVSEACGGFRPRCLISVSSGWCGDPAPGVVKTLTVEYTCGATRKRASAAEHTGLELACP
jgi:Galactose binding lectin domain